jgi:hypothetical protein
VKIHIGFTGTQDGMTEKQKRTVHRLVIELGATDLHHGDCIGSDDQADMIARELGLWLHIHPPSNPSKRAWCVVPSGLLTLYQPLPYLERNHAIVDAAAALIATPKEMTETLRSGTWATVRYARRQRKPLHIAWPDGTLSQEPHP